MTHSFRVILLHKLRFCGNGQSQRRKRLKEGPWELMLDKWEQIVNKTLPSRAPLARGGAWRDRPDGFAPKATAGAESSGKPNVRASTPKDHSQLPSGSRRLTRKRHRQTGGKGSRNQPLAARRRVFEAGRSTRLKSGRFRISRRPKSSSPVPRQRRAGRLVPWISTPFPRSRARADTRAIIVAHEALEAGDPVVEGAGEHDCPPWSASNI